MVDFLKKIGSFLKEKEDLRALVPSIAPPQTVAVLALSGVPAKSIQVYGAKDVGGKGANLLRLRRAGLNVPSFLCISVSEFDRLLQRAAEKTKTSFRAFVSGDDASAGRSLSEAILSDRLSDEAQAFIKQFLQSFPNRSFAVRSSANVEDGADSAFAGQFHTHLNVRGQEHVEKAVLECFASLLSDTVRPYLKKALDASETFIQPSMAVVIMEQLNSTAAGVYFQANPVSGALSTHVVNVAQGQGEGVVSGLVESDEFWLNSETGKVKRSNISTKTKKIILTEGEGTKEVPVAASDAEKPVLSEAQIAKLYKASGAISKAYNSPQDIEFAFEGEHLYVLQARPITTRLENLKWQAPDEGLWRVNAHVSHPMSAIYSKIWCKGWSDGLAWNSINLTGAGMSRVDTCTINGFGYFCMRFPGPKAAPKSAPPEFLMRTLLRLTGGRDTKTATAFWKDKGYLSFREEFRKVHKPEWIAKHRALQSENLTDKSDAEVLDYLERCHKHLEEAWFAHTIYTLHQMLPGTYFALKCQEWTGCTLAEAYGALEGYSPVTEGIIGEFPEEIALIAANDNMKAILSSMEGTPDERLAKLRALKDDAPAHDALERIIGDVEFRLVSGYDPVGNILRENPIMILSMLQTAVSTYEARKVKPKEPIGLALGNAIRERVPQTRVAEYDLMLSEMRSMMFIRDERALFTDLWASGILHHALVLVAERLIRRGGELAKPGNQDLPLDASMEELRELINSKQSVPESLVKVWADRKRFRATTSIRDAPELLNGKDISLKPSHFPNEYLYRSYITSITSVHNISTPTDMEDRYERLASAKRGGNNKTLFGLAGSAGITEGIARVVLTTEDCVAVKKGEIIVTESPSSLINLILPFASAIVTDFGATLSHAAVCAREAGYPCVIGCKNGTTTLKTGMKIRVNGSEGIVEILEDVKNA